MKKMTCRECVRTCCDGQTITRKHNNIGVDPDKLKPGSWLEVKGIGWVKLKTGFWRCRAFDPKTRLCRIWRYRPSVCRDWTCLYVRKRYHKRVSNYDERVKLDELENYELRFSVSGEEDLRRRAVS